MSPPTRIIPVMIPIIRPLSISFPLWRENLHNFSTDRPSAVSVGARLAGPLKMWRVLGLAAHLSALTLLSSELDDIFRGNFLRFAQNGITARESPRDNKFPRAAVPTMHPFFLFLRGWNSDSRKVQPAHKAEGGQGTDCSRAALSLLASFPATFAKTAQTKDFLMASLERQTTSANRDAAGAECSMTVAASRHRVCI
jgi:hypothetical protein